MKVTIFGLGILICFCGGILAFLVQNEFILVRCSTTKESTNHSTPPICKKEIVCYFWHTDRWQEDKHLCLWVEKKEVNLKQLITIWLDTLSAENTQQSTRVAIQAITFNKNEHHAFISFDRNPLPSEGPFFLKLMWVEGLLKTIRHSDIPLQSISFLHNHQLLQDTHLDFSQRWPITGFLD